MFVNGLGTANPAHRYSKSDCWEAFKASDWFRQLDRRAHMIAESVLLKDNGIAWRSLAVGSLDEVFHIDPDTLHNRFLANAPALGAAAATSALDEAGLAAREIDGVVISTCTGYLCPGLTSYVIERLGLRADVLAFDLVGQGLCGGAAELAPRRCAAGGRVVPSRAVHLRRGQQRRDVSRQRSRRVDQRVPVRRRGGSGGVVPGSESASPRDRVEIVRVTHQSRGTRRAAVRNQTRHAAQCPDAGRFPGWRPSTRSRCCTRCWRTPASRPDTSLRGSCTRAGAMCWPRCKTGCALPRIACVTARHILRRYGNMSSAFVYFVLQAALLDNCDARMVVDVFVRRGIQLPWRLARGGVIWPGPGRGHGPEPAAARGAGAPRRPRRRRPARPPLATRLAPYSPRHGDVADRAACDGSRHGEKPAAHARRARRRRRLPDAAAGKAARSTVAGRSRHVAGPARSCRAGDAGRAAPRRLDAPRRGDGCVRLAGNARRRALGCRLRQPVHPPLFVARARAIAARESRRARVCSFAASRDAPPSPWRAAA